MLIISLLHRAMFKVINISYFNFLPYYTQYMANFCTMSYVTSQVVSSFVYNTCIIYIRQTPYLKMAFIILYVKGCLMHTIPKINHSRDLKRIDNNITDV